MLVRLTLLLAGFAATAPADWDVEDTGQAYRDVEFNLTEGTWLSVDVSPDGRQLAFDLLGDIYILPTEGGTARLVHGGPVMTRTPRFNSDGSRLLYLSDQSGGDNVWSSNLDGSQAQQLTFEDVDVLTSPVWVPGGDEVAAVRLSSHYRDLNTSELRHFFPGISGGQILVPSPGSQSNVSEPAFSPDGSYLYYTQKVGGPAKFGGIFIDANHPVHAVMRHDLQSGHTLELIKGFGGATTPRVSPNNTLVAFVRRLKDKTVLFTYNTVTGEQKPAYAELSRDMQGEWIAQGTYYPQYGWFPDNRHVAIWGKGQLLKVDTHSGTATPIPFQALSRHRITKAVRFAGELGEPQIEVKAIRHLAVAPGGGRIAFNAVGRLWQKSLPDGVPRRITSGNALEFEPAFSPDGQQIAYVEWDDESGSALKLIGDDGIAVRTLARSKGVIRQPGFSPDGAQLVYHIETGNMCMSGPATGPGTDSGLYTVAVQGSVPVRVTDQAASPFFSPDGQRIFFTSESYSSGEVVTRLQSVNLAGNQRRDHVVMTGADRSSLSASHDLAWVAFKENQQYFIMPLMDMAGPMTASSTGVTASPVERLTDLGGYSLTWAAGSSRVYWLLGEKLHSADKEDWAAGKDSHIPIALTVSSDVPTGKLALTGARLITMNGESIERGTILIEGNVITAVGDAEAVEVPPGADRLDLTGTTILPGLINMHGHLEDCYYDSTGALPQKQAAQYASLAFGVTTNFDPYATELPSLASSEMREAGATVGPRTFSVGSVLFGRAGKPDSVYTPINSFKDAQNVMRRKVELGARLVKSYRQPLRRQRQQIIKAAREAGIMVAIEGESHYYNNISALLDGHNTIEHNLPVATYYDDVVQLFAHSKTATTPTLTASFGEMLGENYIYQQGVNWDDPRIASFVPFINSGYSPIGMSFAGPLYARAMTSLHAADELWDIGFRAVARSTAELDASGVLVNVGSHSQVQGLAMHWEMQLLSEGGMSNERILRAATLNGARTLGLDRHIGSLAVGKLADLIVLEENPLEDIRHTESVRYTVIDGRVYDARSMNEIIRRTKPRSKFYWE